MLNKDRANEVIQTSLKDGMPIQLSKLIACQGAFESDNFTSRVFLADNNSFGYKYTAKSDHQDGPGLVSTEGDHYAHYKTFDDSIQEICSWIKRRQAEAKFPVDLTKIQTGNDYAYLLKSCGYFGSKENDYAAGINMYLKELSDEGMA